MIDYDYIGIDIAKDKFDVAYKKGKRFINEVFPNNKKGFACFLSSLKKHTTNPWACMESTGCYGTALIEFLYKQGIRISCVNALKVKYFAKSILSRNKNDIVDARVIAEYCQLNQPRLTEPKSAEQKARRELLQLIDTLKQQTAGLKNKLHACESSLAKKMTIQAINSNENRCQRLEAQIAKMIADDEKLINDVKLICSIKGVGEQSAIRLLTYLPDLSLFKTAKQLAAFAGLSPMQRESGKYKGKTCLSKLGDPSLRKILYMPALSAKRHNEHLQAFVLRLEKNGLCPKAILGAMMRKLLHLIFGMLKSGKPFDPALA